MSRYAVPEWVPVPSAAWVHQQVYLHPYPKELMLRNHVWDQRRTDGMVCMFVENPPVGYPQIRQVVTLQIRLMADTSGGSFVYNDSDGCYRDGWPFLGSPTNG